MSKTPLTDSARLSASERVRFARAKGVMYELTPAEFARKLERDRAVLIAMIRIALAEDGVDISALTDDTLLEGIRMTLEQRGYKP